DRNHHRRCRPRTETAARRRRRGDHQVHRSDDRKGSRHRRRRSRERQTDAQEAVKRACAALLSALAVLAGSRATVHAVDLRNVLTDYTLPSWSRKDGLTGPVWAIAQDGDGFLCLGNDDGLVRFDGVRFVPWDRLGAAPLPRLTGRSLHVAHDKSLWIGFGAAGGIARIQGKSVRVYGAPDGAGTGGGGGDSGGRSPSCL